MSACRIRHAAFLLTAGLILSGTAAAIEDVPLRNWSVPGGGAQKGFSPTADLGNGPVLFVPVTPCRIVETRLAPGPYGAPSLSAGVSRAFNIPGGPCTGIPTGATAFSLNFTVVASAGAYAGAFLSAWPTGGSQPSVSTLNFNGGQIVANAAIVPAAAGSITVVANRDTALIIDINGYYIGGASASMNAGEFVGIVGNPTGWAQLLFVYANATTAIGSIRGINTSALDTSFGTSGEVQGVTGVTYGVKGINLSNTENSAGVVGRSGTASPPAGSLLVSQSGVRGETGTNGFGVAGISRLVGVGGFVVDGTGAVLRYGYVGGLSAGLEYGGGLTGSGTKNFVEPHPSDASKMIVYTSLEGPEAGTYFRGRGRFVNGSARIEVPESFRMVTDPEGITVVVTPIGRPTSVGVTRIGLDGIEVEAIRDVEFSYVVQGMRRAYRDVQAIVPNTFFRPNSSADRMPVVSPDERQRLIDTGIYNADGTVNMATAERLGWARAWRDRDAENMAAAERAAVAAGAGQDPFAGARAVVPR